MKKIVCIALTLLILVGCGGKNETKVTTCTMSNEGDGIKTELKIDLENDGTYISKQIQHGIVTAENDEVYENLVATMENFELEETTKNMKGVNYELTKDKSNRSVTETIEIDITKVSGKDYSTLTNGQVESNDKEIKVVLDKTVERLEKQGFTCKTK